MCSATSPHIFLAVGAEIHAVDPRWPTESDMVAMRNEALTVHPSMILWYSLRDILSRMTRRATGVTW